MITNPPPTDFSTPCPSTRRPDKPSASEKFKKPFKEVLFKGKKLNVTDKTYKVYFGKKANHKCRYFKAISYNRRMGRMEICVSSAIEPVVLEDSTGGVSQKRVIRMLREFKPLENLETNGVTRSFLSGIKQLTRLQSLTITLDEKQMLENCSVFRGLRALSNVHLVVKKNKNLESADREGFSLSFFRHLLSKETLKALKFELQDSLIFSNSAIVEELLYYISQSKATMFNVQVRLKEHNAFNLARISEFLAQVDFLALQFTYRSRNNEYKNRDEMLENFGLNKWLQEGRIYEELNSAMGNSQKALRIQYKRRPQMDVSLLLAQCMALHSLCLQWKNYQSTIPKEFKFAKGLRNLYLGFQQLKDEEIGSLLSNVNDMLEEVKSIEGLNIMLDSKYFGQQSLTELYGIYQQISSKGIKNHSLEIFDDCFTGGKNLKPEALEILSEEMRCMRNLDRLKMYFNGGSTGFLREMQMTLSHYKGLRYLDMLIFSQYHTETNFMFPFESLSGLVELRMRFIGPLVKRCAEHLAKNLGFLKDIEVLEISEGCLYNTNLDTFVSMMRKLNKMHRLKELNIQVPDVIDEEEEYERQRRLFGGENYESFTAQLGKDVRDLYKTNECLEKACLYFQQNFYLDIMTERQVR